MSGKSPRVLLSVFAYICFMLQVYSLFIISAMIVVEDMEFFRLEIIVSAVGLMLVFVGFCVLAADVFKCYANKDLEELSPILLLNKPFWSTVFIVHFLFLPLLIIPVIRYRTKNGISRSEP